MTFILLDLFHKYWILFEKESVSKYPNIEPMINNFVNTIPQSLIPWVTADLEQIAEW